MYLVYSIQELQEDGAEVRDVSGGSVVAFLGELVAKGEPVLLNEGLEPLHGAVVRVKKDLGQRHNLHVCWMECKVN